MPADVPDRVLPRFGQWRASLIEAERNRGWLDECDDANRFLAVNRELVDALSLVLRRLLKRGPILELCAGAGDLAQGLAAAGLRLHATDAEPPDASRVLRITAPEALRRFQPDVVLGVFVPFDAGVDESVLACRSVDHYVVLNARIGGSFASPRLWETPEWEATPLETVSRWMITRHDAWLGHDGRTSRSIIQHGEAWHFARQGSVWPVAAGQCGGS